MPVIGRLCIIGTGLIGGSLGLSLKAANACEHIIGCSRNRDHLETALERGIIDSYSTDPADAAAGSDMVVLAVPLGSMQAIMEIIKPGMKAGTILTDVGSAKRSVVDAANAVFGDLPPGFVPAHPIAGNENSGVEAAIPDLYRGRRVIITPLPTSSEDAIQTVSGMWQSSGAEIKTMDVDEHDRILAATSHLPHMLAFALVRELANNPHHDDIFRYAAGGLRDFTRIAESDPLMWRDICLANKDALLPAIDRYLEELGRLRKSIESQDAEALQDMFAEAHDARAHFRRLLDAREREQD